VWRLVTLALAALLCASSASAQSYHGRDIAGSGYGNADYPFTDHDGNPRTLRDYRGRAILLFFGFLNCPNYCPLTLSKFSAALDMLGKEGNRVQVLYVTLDPERDSPERLRNHVRAFHPGFIGLYATPEATPHMALAFNIHNARVKGRQPGNYTIDHSVFAYAYDAETRLRLLLPDELTAEQIAADIRKLLK
jgi:protein SCO1/2